jgi:hypothetical protein
MNTPHMNTPPHASRPTQQPRQPRQQHRHRRRLVLRAWIHSRVNWVNWVDWVDFTGGGCQVARCRSVSAGSVRPSPQGRATPTRGLAAAQSVISAVRIRHPPCQLGAGQVVPSRSAEQVVCWLADFLRCLSVCLSSRARVRACVRACVRGHSDQRGRGPVGGGSGAGLEDCREPSCGRHRQWRGGEDSGVVRRADEQVSGHR